MSICLNPVGVVCSTRRMLEDDRWDTEKCRIELDQSQFNEESLLGLTEFSHAEVIFYMDKVNPSKIEKSARHPRNNSNWPKVGIFARRGKNRPNQIGTTICKISRIEGRTLYVEGLDAVDGTPVLDIKPWVAEFGPRGSIFQPSWKTVMMKSYWS